MGVQGHLPWVSLQLKRSQDERVRHIFTGVVL